MSSSPCVHYLDLGERSLGCERELHHAGKHWAYVGGVAVGPHPRGGKRRRDVSVKIEWTR